jgi:hypothetical protein
LTKEEQIRLEREEKLRLKEERKRQYVCNLFFLSFFGTPNEKSSH